MALDRVADAKRESKTLDFKSEFDPDDQGSWCEVIKDVVAMANTAGGIIVVGVNNDGSCNASPTVDRVLAIDPATVTDKIARYTGVQYDGVSILEARRHDARVAVLEIRAVLIPMVFEKAGNYCAHDGKQKCAFTTGTFYVRHGAKSEPANSNDLKEAVERNLDAARREWATGVRQVISAPPGSVISVLPAELANTTGASTTPIRITSDPGAPAFKLVDPDVTHPWRGKELIAEVNRRLNGVYLLNQFDIQAVRRVHSVDSNPQFFHKAVFGAPQYSQAFASWLIDEFHKDAGFFGRARKEHKRRLSRRQRSNSQAETSKANSNTERVVGLELTREPISDSSIVAR